MKIESHFYQAASHHLNLFSEVKMRLLKTTAFTQTTEEYASRSSIHGIGYIFDRELGIFDRVLWLLVVFFFLGVAGALTGNLWTQWRDEQVIMIK